MFPLAGLTKEFVKKMAAEAGLHHVLKKKEVRDTRGVVGTDGSLRLTRDVLSEHGDLLHRRKELRELHSGGAAQNFTQLCSHLSDCKLQRLL